MTPPPPSPSRLPPTPLSPDGLSAEERTAATLIHLSPLAGLLLPSLGHLLGPLVAWLAYRERSAALDAQGKEVLNFQLTLTLISFVLGTLLFVLMALGMLGGVAGASLSPDLGVFALFGSLAAFFALFIPLALLLSLIPLVFMVIGVSRAGQGRLYRYPLTWRFLR